MKAFKLLVIAVVALASFAGDSGSKQKWGTVDGKDVYLYTFTNKSGMQVAITNYAAAVQAIRVPDKNGKVDDIALGFDTLADYREKNSPHFGTIVGRVGNRIAKGQFTLDGKTYKLPLNNKTNTLHGGYKGFDQHVWAVQDVGPEHITLHYLSKDGEEGFPGNLDTTVKYTLTADNALVIDYTVKTDKDTIQNLTNHTYFNLAGEGNGDVLKQVLTINADRFTPDDKELLPTGEIKSVVGTPFDFRTPHAIGERIDAKDEQIVNGMGYDHNFILNGTGMRWAAKVTDPGSGRTLEVDTDQPAVQLYSSNFLDGTVKGKDGKGYVRRGAFCLETQHYPDSPSHPNFPSIELKAGQTFRSKTVFKFGVKK